jgi:hypothetical protein
MSQFRRAHIFSMVSAMIQVPSYSLLRATQFTNENVKSKVKVKLFPQQALEAYRIVC